MKTFEFEIWPNPKKTRTIYFSIGLVTILAWACFAAANLCWTPEYVHYVKQAEDGSTMAAGWPVKLYWWALYTGIAGAVAMVLVYAFGNRKYPLLALNQTGLFIHHQMIKQTLVEWAQVRRIIKIRNEGWTTMEIYLKEGKRLRVDNRFTLGDFDGFAEKAKNYIDKNA